MRTAAAVLLCLCLAGCAAGAAQHRDPSTLVIIEAGDAGSVNPLLTNQYYAFLYQNFVFDTLVGSDADYGPVPKLALSWKSDAAGTTWTVRLRRGVRWSDGAPFSAADVVWTFDALTDLKTGSPYQGQYAFIKRVVALDPFTVRFELSSPNATFMANALQSQWIMPEHLFRGTAHAQIARSDFGQHPVGTGPYVLASWSHDQEARFTANPHWWGGTPGVRAIDVRVVLDEQGRVDAMLDGSADINDGMNADDALRLRRDPGIAQINVPDLYTRFMQLNLRKPGLDDVAVRRAMMYAWDREGLAHGLRHDAGTVASSVEPTALRVWHDAHVAPYPFDLRRARELLDSAGWTPQADGIRAKGPTRLAYTLTLPNSTLGKDVAAQFQADMLAAGIAIDVRMLDYATFISETNASHFDLAYTGWGGSPDPDMLTLLDSKQMPPTGNNYGFYKNPAVDRDVEQGLLVVDPARRRAYYDDMQVRTAQDVPVLFATNENYLVAYRRRVHINGPVMPGLYLYTNVTTWRLDP